MKTLLVSVTAILFITCVAPAYAFDLGAEIIQDDAALGTNPGEIHVTASGVVSEGKVSLSAGHDLVCDTNQITISLNPGSYFYQNSHTSIKNCSIASSSTYIQGEIQSINTTNLLLENVTFAGGGNLVYWSGVTTFTISGNTILSITAVHDNSESDFGASGFYLLHCSDGNVTNLTVKSFLFPPETNTAAILGLSLSSNITVTNPDIEGVDASFIRFGAGAIAIAGSDHITVNGGTLINNSNTDGILSELYKEKGPPSQYLTFTGFTASFNGGQGANPNPFGTNVLGDGIDLINSAHVSISNCMLNGDGYANDMQPGIWIFIDDDVQVSNCDISDGSSIGVEMAGSINVRLLNNTINRNKGSGVYVEWQTGTGTSVGPTVTVVSGPTGGFGLSWQAGTPFMYDGVMYQVASVPDSGHVVLTTAPTGHSSPASWSVDSSVQIEGDIINDNGQGGFGGQNQVGISLADGTSAQISGVTATDTGAGTQLYGLELANTVAVYLNNNNFFPNVETGSGIFGGETQHFDVSSLSFPDQNVGTTSASQLLPLHAGAVALQSLQIQTSGDFSQSNDCGATLQPYATCNIQVTFNPTTAGARAGYITINDNAPLSPQIVSVAGNGIAVGLGLTVLSGSASVASIAPGATAHYTLSIGGGGISGIASLTCTGAPQGATCKIPATQVVSGATPANFTVTVTTTAATAATIHRFPLRSSSWAIFLIAFVALPVRRKRKHDAARHLLLALFLLTLLCSCGGSMNTGSTLVGGGTPGTTPAGTYTLTVTAKVSSTSAQIPLTLTVQ
jgi:Right handed beta helix region